MRNALQFLRRAGARLLLTRLNGKAKYSINGSGRVATSTARRILGRRSIVVEDAGLLCDHPQSWKRLARGPHYA
jgi:hypothetical protein